MYWLWQQQHRELGGRPEEKRGTSADVSVIGGVQEPRWKNEECNRNSHARIKTLWLLLQIGWHVLESVHVQLVISKFDSILRESFQGEIARMGTKVVRTVQEADDKGSTQVRSSYKLEFKQQLQEQNKAEPFCSKSNPLEYELNDKNY